MSLQIYFHLILDATVEKGMEETRTREENKACEVSSA